MQTPRSGAAHAAGGARPACARAAAVVSSRAPLRSCRQAGSELSGPALQPAARRALLCRAAAAGAPGWPRQPGGHRAGARGWPRQPGGHRADDAAPPPAASPPAAEPPALTPVLLPAAASLDALLPAAQAALDGAGDALRAAARRATRLRRVLSRPEALLLREGLQLLACLLFILLYIWSTYSPVVPGGGRWWCDLLLSLLFAADWVNRILMSSNHRLLAVLHPLALIDALSFAPSLLGALLPDFVAPWGMDLRWFRVFRALRLLRLSLLSGNLSTMKTNRGVLIAGNLNVPLVWLVASVVAWMFTSASCVAVMERLPWHDALYFVGSTLTTVGYGDVVVKSSMGRLFVLVMMLVGVVLIPVRASQLYSRLSERLLEAGHVPGDAPGAKGRFVVLSARLSDVRGFNDLLQDFLLQVHSLPRPQPSSGPQGVQLVCLCNKPSVEFLALQELHEASLTLIEGSAFNERDLLLRAALPSSLGALVLADRFSSNAAAEDTDVQFRVWAIKAAVKRVPLYVQVLRRAAVDVISPFLDPQQDVITSVEGTRMRLLALSCFAPGASTLIANLLRSSGPNAGFPGGPRFSASALGARARAAAAAAAAASSVSSLGSLSGSPTGSADDGAWGQPGTWLQDPARASWDAAEAEAAAKAASAPLAGRRWLREYADGAHCELHIVPAGPPLAGLRFAGAAEAVYEATGALLVGLVQVKSQRLLLNPSSYVLQQGQQLLVLADTRRIAEVAAAGEGVETALYSQALRAAMAATVAAAAAAADPAGGGGGSSEAAPARAGEPQPAAPGQPVHAQAVPAARAAPDPQPSAAGARGVRVLVPDLAMRAGLTQPQQLEPPPPPRSQQLEQQSQQPQPQPPSPPQQQRAAAAGAAFADDGGHAAAAYAAFASQEALPRPWAVAHGHSGSPGLPGEDVSEDEAELLDGCLQTWSGAYESDSLDETELCTDSELLEAALLQRQRQQRLEKERPLAAPQHTQAGGGGRTYAAYGGAPGGSGSGSSGGSSGNGRAPLPGNSAGNSAAGGSAATGAAGVDVAGWAQPPQPQQQEQQQPPGALPPPVPPALSGHIIVAGCASSFATFARQLAASAPPEAGRLALVLLHPELPPPVAEAIARLPLTLFYVRGLSSDAAALEAARASAARGLVYAGPCERPTNLPALAVSGVFGDPTTAREASLHPSDLTSSRTAVLADADALSSCYGVGELLQPDSVPTLVELGFTSSIRFLQPGLLLHGRSAPHSHGSFDDSQPWGPAGLLAGLPGLQQWLQERAHPLLAAVAGGSDGSAQGRGGSASRQGSSRPASPAPASRPSSPAAAAAAGVSRSGRSSPATQQQQEQAWAQLQAQQQPPWPWQQQPNGHAHTPRSSWRHRKEVEEAGQAEGLTEWQVNAYFAAGRVMVPALLDTFTVQGFFKRRALLDLLTELAGDDGRPGGAMLRQLPVPPHLVGCPYRALVRHFLAAAEPEQRCVPLGLLRRKAENRAWRLPYVATHPLPGTLLQATDRVFVVRPQ